MLKIKRLVIFISLALLLVYFIVLISNTTFSNNTNDSSSDIDNDDNYSYLNDRYTKQQQLKQIVVDTVKNHNNEITTNRLNSTSSFSISIIIPLYNQLKYIKYTLDSLVTQSISLQQSYTWEVIIVDDFSSEWMAKERLLEIYNEYSTIFTTITLIFNSKNLGLSECRNIGITYSKGIWILPLDADDLIHSEFLEKSLKLLKNKHNNLNNNILVSNMYKFVSESNFQDDKIVGQWNIPKWDSSIIPNRNLLHCSSIFRKSLWEMVGGYSNELWFGWEDWEFWLRSDRTLQNTTGTGLSVDIVGGDNPMFYYRIKPGLHSFCGDEYRLCFAMFQTVNPHLYAVDDIILAHRYISTRGKLIRQPIQKRIKQFPNLPILYFWMGLIEFHSFSNLKVSKEHFENALKLNLNSNHDWQFMLQYSLVLKETRNGYFQSKSQLDQLFDKYSHINLKHNFNKFY
ncbi:hypothetical protein DLAC_05379 [Tieghemostelium lacteum]|uniref:Glycosyltransferase 2-like domain-containing protein n=1 Tax=Tieghemostelium lacteum TaxID=361077 RepID=A0A151ZFU3_TIELA|nr:hypothetical protein DLAC_05379 [Tieghemostelium lacteum]|eukprot:KYQ92797.1 hypothetical protein DLAC_05379 [Tieghemostelium lacteum]